jgi:excisionase family DNA binding protein
MRQQPGGAAIGSGTVERRVLREDEILTSEEARRLLKIGRTKLWDLTKKNMIPAYRVGEGRTSGLRYKRSELMRWLDNNRI